MNSALHRYQTACERWSDRTFAKLLGPYEPSELPAKEPSLILDLAYATKKLIDDISGKPAWEMVLGLLFFLIFFGFSSFIYEVVFWVVWEKHAWRWNKCTKRTVAENATTRPPWWHKHWARLVAILFAAVFTIPSILMYVALYIVYKIVDA